jgi:rsbT co-antagonist protein RsbR
MAYRYCFRTLTRYGRPQMQIDSSQARMAAVLRENQDKILARWSEIVLANNAGRVGADAVRRELAEILGIIERAMTGADESAAGELRATLAELSRSRAREGGTPTETATSVFSLKDAVFELVADKAEMVPEFLAFSRMVDDLGLHTFETYVVAREQIIADQTESMLELSTPVVRLWDGIIAVPLVGTLDSARTQLVMEKMLNALVDLGAEHAVIDITGVPTVDTEVAQHLLKTVMARGCSEPNAPSPGSGRRSRIPSSRSASSSATSPRRPAWRMRSPTR